MNTQRITILENGHEGNAWLNVGDYQQTQWGQRKVVEVKFVKVPDSRDDFDNGSQ